MTRRTWAKQTLRGVGETTYGNYLEVFKRFLDEVKLREEPLGILFEYALAYLLGVFQGEYKEHFAVIMTDYLDDEEKVDFLINGHKLQIKIDWDDSKLPIDKETQYRLFAIKILTFHRKDPNGYNTSGIDVLREILSACGFSEKLIEANIDNPAFDAAEEILSNWLFN